MPTDLLYPVQLGKELTIHFRTEPAPVESNARVLCGRFGRVTSTWEPWHVVVVANLRYAGYARCANCRRSVAVTDALARMPKSDMKGTPPGARMQRETDHARMRALCPPHPLRALYEKGSTIVCSRCYCTVATGMALSELTPQLRARLAIADDQPVVEGGGE